jgi:hypothetical protein
MSPELILQLQTTVGNRAVQRLLEPPAPIEGPAPIPQTAWWRHWRFAVLTGSAILAACLSAAVWFLLHE